MYWTFKADGGVRTAPSVGRAGTQDAVYFGDLEGQRVRARRARPAR